MGQTQGKEKVKIQPGTISNTFSRSSLESSLESGTEQSQQLAGLRSQQRNVQQPPTTAVEQIIQNQLDSYGSQHSNSNKEGEGVVPSKEQNEDPSKESSFESQIISSSNHPTLALNSHASMMNVLSSQALLVNNQSSKGFSCLKQPQVISQIFAYLNPDETGSLNIFLTNKKILNMLKIATKIIQSFAESHSSSQHDDSFNVLSEPDHNTSQQNVKSLRNTSKQNTENSNKSKQVFTRMYTFAGNKQQQQEQAESPPQLPLAQQRQISEIQVQTLFDANQRNREYDESAKNNKSYSPFFIRQESKLSEQRKSKENFKIGWETKGNANQTINEVVLGRPSSQNQLINDDYSNSNIQTDVRVNEALQAVNENRNITNRGGLTNQQVAATDGESTPMDMKNGIVTPSTIQVKKQKDSSKNNKSSGSNRQGTTGHHNQGFQDRQSSLMRRQKEGQMKNLQKTSNLRSGESNQNNQDYQYSLQTSIISDMSMLKSRQIDESPRPVAQGMSHYKRIVTVRDNKALLKQPHNNNQTNLNQANSKQKKDRIEAQYDKFNEMYRQGLNERSQIENGSQAITNQTHNNRDNDAYKELRSVQEENDEKSEKGSTEKHKKDSESKSKSSFQKSAKNQTSIKQVKEQSTSPMQSLHMQRKSAQNQTSIQHIKEDSQEIGRKKAHNGELIVEMIGERTLHSDETFQGPKIKNPQKSGKSKKQKMYIDEKDSTYERDSKRQLTDALSQYSRSQALMQTQDFGSNQNGQQGYDFKHHQRLLYQTSRPIDDINSVGTGKSGNQEPQNPSNMANYIQIQEHYAQMSNFGTKQPSYQSENDLRKLNNQQFDHQNLMGTKLHIQQFGNDFKPQQLPFQQVMVKKSPPRIQNQNILQQRPLSQLQTAGLRAMQKNQMHESGPYLTTGDSYPATTLGLNTDSGTDEEEQSSAINHQQKRQKNSRQQANGVNGQRLAFRIETGEESSNDSREEDRKRIANQQINETLGLLSHKDKQAQKKVNKFEQVKQQKASLKNLTESIDKKSYSDQDAAHFRNLVMSYICKGDTKKVQELLSGAPSIAKHPAFTDSRLYNLTVFNKNLSESREEKKLAPVAVAAIIGDLHLIEILLNYLHHIDIEKGLVAQSKSNLVLKTNQSANLRLLSPLQIACSLGIFQVVARLIQEGADPNVLTPYSSRRPNVDYGELPLDIILNSKNHCTDLEHEGVSVQPKIDSSIDKDYEVCLKILLQSKADLDPEPELRHKSEDKRPTPIFQAIRDEKFLHIFLQYARNSKDIVNRMNFAGQTPLVLVAQGENSTKNEIICQALLEEGASINASTQNPLIVAMEAKNYRVMRLLNRIQSLQKQQTGIEQDSRRIIQTAVKQNDPKLIAELIQWDNFDGDLETVDKDGRNIFHMLTMNQDLNSLRTIGEKMVKDAKTKKLLHKLMNESHDQSGQSPQLTPLFYAFPNLNIAKACLKFGANVQRLSFTHCLDTYWPNLTYLSFLVKTGGLDVNSTNQIEAGRLSPLIAAFEQQDEEKVKFLWEMGAKIDERTFENGRTPLLEAAYRGEEAMFRTLIACGADKSIRCLMGRTINNYIRLENENKSVYTVNQMNKLLYKDTLLRVALGTN